MHTFPNHTKQAWIEKITKELPNGKSLSDFMISNEFYTHDGFPTQTVEIKGFMPSTSWLITSDISDLSNNSALQALENGSEALVFEIKSDTNFKTLLKDIRLDYITSCFGFSEIKKLDEFQNYLSENYSMTDLEVFTYGIDNLCNSISYKYSDHSLEHLITLFKTIANAVESNEENIIINYTIQENFYENIAILRAMKILFANIISANGKSNKLIIIARHPDHKLNIDRALIKMSLAALSSVIGGANFISLLSWNSDNSNEARLAQNIQHLLKEESSLHLFEDAMAGSYFIEDITTQIVEKVWVWLMVKG